MSRYGYRRIMSNPPLALPVESFIRSVPPRKRGRLSLLVPYRAGVFELSAAGYGPVQIAQWLSANGVKVSPSAVTRFIRREMERGV